MKLYNTTERWWVEVDGQVGPLPGFDLDQWLARPEPVADCVKRVRDVTLTKRDLPPLRLPLGSQEIWAAGVTYLRSKTARMEESEYSATAYDRVYDAARPELFFKATPGRCAGPGGQLQLRSDSRWMVPEPELTLVISAAGKVAGFTVGDDLSCRDIEGENMLYLPQAKIWDGCCALGPCILVNEPGLDLRTSSISLEIQRNGRVEFSGQTSVGRMKRPYEELIDYLFRHQSFPQGVLMLTGTGVVPGDDFTLRPGDRINMTVPEIGTLINDIAQASCL